MPLSGSSALNMLIVRQVKHETHGSRPVLLVFFFRFFIHFSFHFLIFHVALFVLCARPYSDCDATAAEVAASAFSDILSDLLPILPWVKLVSYGLLQVLRGDALQEMQQPMHFGQSPRAFRSFSMNTLSTLSLLEPLNPQQSFHLMF